MAQMKIFAGRSHENLARDICDYLGMPMGAAHIVDFPDSETFVKLDEDVRGRDVFIIQPTCAPVNDTLMELLIFIDCARRASADRITAVIPYFGYARQDRKDEGRVPITAKMVANMIVSAGVDRVLTIDLHSGQVQGFFDVPLDNLYAEPVLTRYLRGLNLDDVVLVSPDVGSVKRARSLCKRLDGGLAIIDKCRVSASEAEAGQMIGNVKDKTVVMIDDVITTAGTVCSAAALCRAEGARKIYVAATHGVLCGPAIQRLSEAPIDEVIVTDTVPIPPETIQAIGCLTVLSTAELIGEAMHRIHNDESISNLFLQKNGQS